MVDVMIITITGMIHASLGGKSLADACACMQNAAWQACTPGLPIAADTPAIKPLHAAAVAAPQPPPPSSFKSPPWVPALDGHGAPAGAHSGGACGSLVHNVGEKKDTCRMQRAQTHCSKVCVVVGESRGGRLVRSSPCCVGSDTACTRHA